MLVTENKITEANSIFDTSKMDDPDFVQKMQSRVRALNRAMDQAERAAGIAEKNGDHDRAKKLLDRAQELQDLIDLQEREEEQQGLGNNNASEGENSSEEPENTSKSEAGKSGEGESEQAGESEENAPEENAPGQEGSEQKPNNSNTNQSGESEDGEDKQGDSGKGKSANNEESEEGEDAGEDPGNEGEPTGQGEATDRGDTQASSHGESGEGNDSGNQNNSQASSNSSSSSSSSSNSQSGQDSKSSESGDDGEGKSDEFNPFEMDPNANPSMGKGGKMPKEPSIETIIKILKRTSGDGRLGVKKALHDILVKRGIDPTLYEALKPLPKKSLMDLSDDEFNDIINDVLDEVDSITPLPFEDTKERKNRVNKINADKDNAFANRELEVEDNVNIQKDRAILKAREQEKRKYSNFKSIEQFKINFWRTIKDQVEKYEEVEETPTRINRQYDGEDIVKKGERSEEKWSDEKPSIDLYFDMSGSWTSNESAVNIGKQAVKTIKEFDDAGEIVLNVYYFSNSVVTSMDDPSLGRGTDAWTDILQHIKQNNTKNVVLMTDSDMEWDAQRGATCVVDGCVWLIWRDGDQAPAIVNHLIGKQGTQQYSFSSND